MSADPIAVTWSSLLLAIAPAPLAAAAAFAPPPVNLLAAVAGVTVMVVGAAGQVTHTGLFFVPSLVVLAVGAVKLWREQPWSRGRRCSQVTGYLTGTGRRSSVLLRLVAVAGSGVAVVEVLQPARR